MPFYETVFIARQDVSTTQVEGMTQSLTELLTSHDAKVVKTESWGLRSLTYKIKKNRKGHYVMFNIDGSHKAVAELERSLRYNEDILRYMTVRIEELSDEPSPMMAPRGGARGERGERGDRNERFGGGNDRFASDRGGRFRDRDAGDGDEE